MRSYNKSYNKGGYKKKKYKKKEREMNGLSVEVWNNNIELALKKLKRKVKDSNLMLDLKKKSHYEKPSDTKRYKKNLAKLRNKYRIAKEAENERNY